MERDVFNNCWNTVVDSSVPDELCINSACTLAPPGKYSEQLCVTAFSGSAIRGNDVAAPKLRWGLSLTK